MPLPHHQAVAQTFMDRLRRAMGHESIDPVQIGNFQRDRLRRIRQALHLLSAPAVGEEVPRHRPDSSEYASQYSFLSNSAEPIVHELEPIPRSESREDITLSNNTDLILHEQEAMIRPPSREYVSRHIDIELAWQERRLPPTPSAEVFLRGLQIVMIDSLPEDERSCGICHEPYLHGHEHELPVLLPCDHVLGQVCINRWLSPDQDQPKSTCPVCRRSFFDLPETDEYEDDEEDPNNARFLRYINDRVYRHWDQMPPPRNAEEARRQRQTFDEEWNLRLSLITFTRPSIPRETPNVRTALEILRAFQANRSLSWPEAEAFSIEMGQLFMKLRSTMRLMKLFPIWNEYGPPEVAMQHPNDREVIETQLLRFAHIEEALVWSYTGT